VHAPNQSALDSHLIGKKHAKMLALGPPQPQECHVCGLTFVYPSQLKDHLKGPRHRVQSCYLLGMPMPWCFLCSKIITRDNAEHIAGTKHSARLATAAPDDDGRPWVRRAQYPLVLTEEQQSQIFHDELKGTLDRLHSAFGDLWLRAADSDRVPRVNDACTLAQHSPVAHGPFEALPDDDDSPVTDGPIEDMPDDGIFYYDNEGDAVPIDVVRALLSPSP
jgi:hypothetical protein